VDSVICIEHIEQITHVCVECGDHLVCADCEQEARHKGHQFVDIASYVAHYNQQLVNNIHELQNVTNTLSAASQEIQNTKKQVEQVRTKTTIL